MLQLRFCRSVHRGRQLSWARRCRIPAFVNLARRITRIAFGFRSLDALIALAMLSLAMRSLAGHKPAYPAEPTHRSVS